MIQQGPASQNSSMLAYGLEGATNPTSHLYVVNNTFVNDRGSGTAVVVGGSVTTPVVARSNVSTGSTTFVGQAGAVLGTNCVVANPLFVDRAQYDHHLQAGSPCVDAGAAPGSGDGRDLTPVQQYVHPLGHAPRTVGGAAPDAGAFER